MCGGCHNLSGGGANRPYYLTSLGKEKGTYVRVAGTSRPADGVKIKELEMEGVNLSWDELTSDYFSFSKIQCALFKGTDRDIFIESPKTSPKVSPKVSLKTSPKVYDENQDSDTNLTEQQKTIIELIKANPRITQTEIADSIGKSLATVKSYVSVLRKEGIVEYIGSSKNGEWVVRENTADGK